MHVEQFDGSNGTPASGASVSGHDHRRRRPRDAQLRREGHLSPQGGARRRGALERRVPLRRPARRRAVHLDGQRRADRRVRLRRRRSGPARPAARQPQGRSRTILVSWAGQDGAGSGVANYKVEVSRANDGAGASQDDWKTAPRRGPGSNGLHFRGDSGSAYRFRITATDRAAELVDDRDAPGAHPGRRPRPRPVPAVARLEARARGAGLGAPRSCGPRTPGSRTASAFRGTQVALIGRKLPKGGRLRVTLDGHGKVLRLRGRSSHRSVLWVSRRTGGGCARAALPLAGRRTGGARRGGAVAVSAR